MTKGQKSNREIRKPKKSKPKKGAAVSAQKTASVLRVEKKKR
jgi:hypothetical protein